MRALSVLAGLALLGFSAAGLWVDVGNNWQFGLRISTHASIVLACAACGVAVFPAIAGLRGWNILMLTGTGFCILLTVGAAFMNYTAEQGRIADARRGSAEVYASAKQDEDAARREAQAALDEANTIAELGSVDELTMLADRARRTADEQSEAAKALSVLCLAVKACRKAEENLAVMTARLSRAKAKTAALSRAAEARARIQNARAIAKAGPTSSSTAAIWIAAWGDWKVDSAAAAIDAGLAALMIIVTQIFAWLSHPAVKLIVWGLGGPLSAPVSESACRIANASTNQRTENTQHRKRASRTPPANDVAQVRAWTDATLIRRSGAVLLAADVFAAFRYDMGEKLTQAAFGAAMVEVGFAKRRRSGRVLYVDIAVRQKLKLASGA